MDVGGDQRRAEALWPQWMLMTFFFPGLVLGARRRLTTWGLYI